MVVGIGHQCPFLAIMTSLPNVAYPTLAIPGVSSGRREETVSGSHPATPPHPHLDVDIPSREMAAPK